MAVVFIPPLLRPLAAGRETVAIAGGSVRELIDELDRQFPGMRDRLRKGDSLMPGLAVSVDGRIASQGLLQKVGPDSEVHFLPAIGGG